MLAALCALGLIRETLARVVADLDRLDCILGDLLGGGHPPARRREECSDVYFDLRGAVDVISATMINLPGWPGTSAR